MTEFIDIYDRGRYDYLRVEFDDTPGDLGEAVCISYYMPKGDFPEYVWMTKEDAIKVAQLILDKYDKTRDRTLEGKIP